MHGGFRAAAHATGVDVGYLYRLREGQKTEPSDKTLQKLGLRVKARKVVYEKVKA